MSRQKKANRKKLIRQINKREQTKREDACPSHVYVKKTAPRNLYIPEYDYEKCVRCGKIKNELEDVFFA